MVKNRTILADLPNAKMKKHNHKLLALALAGVIYSLSQNAFSENMTSEVQNEKSQQNSTESSSASAKQLDTVSVVGSQIAGGGAAAALPVISLDKEQISSVGATDGNELIRSLPQMGDVTWNPTWLSGANSNAARGDIGSISLRNMGTSNTLLLINGRRSVIHPTTAQVDGGISQTTYNSNAIPMFGLDRMDMLLDGAAAIYGSDAIAGVVDIVTKQNLADGGGIKFEYGTAAGTHREDYQLSGYFGKDFADGRGNVSLMYSFSKRTAEFMRDQWYTATSGRTIRDDGTRAIGGTVGLSNSTPAGRYQLTSGGTAVNGADSSLTWYVDANGNLVQGFAPSSMYVDTNAEPGVTLSPEVKKGNFFGTAHYDLNDNVQVYGELGYYKARSESWISSVTTATNLPTYVSIDSPIVPDELKQSGADAVWVGYYRFSDQGIRPVRVDNTQSRFLVGLRGWTDSGWNWDTAMLYSRAHTDDNMVGIDVTKFVDAMNTGVFNPFTGEGDTSGFFVNTHRKDTAELALWDFKINRPDLVTWYAGAIGMAAGVEARYESLDDNRDSIIDGTYKYTDWYTGSVYASNFFGHSSTPDSYGSRNVKSAFVEFAVPLVKPEFEIPLVKSLDLQVAGRYEKYSDVGDVAKPKFALAWKVNDSLLLRGSYSEGFKAPNLELLNISAVSRYLGYPDYVRYEALVAKGEAPSYTTWAGNANNSYVTVWETTGNKNLKPETSKNKSAGFVFEPSFIPDRFGKFSFGMDWWNIKIENPIGLLTAQNHLYYDAYLRVTQGTSDPAIDRYAPTAADEALYSGSGLAVAGLEKVMHLTYQNMKPLTAEGIDYKLGWRLRDTGIGSFNFTVNVSQLKSYSQEPTEEEKAVQAAIDAGLLHFVIPELGADQVGINGLKPKWKGSATLVWQMNDWTVRLRDQYTGSLKAGVYGDGTPYVVDSQQRWNLSFAKEFKEGFLNGFSVEVGGRNIFNKGAPLDATGNYLASLYEPYGAYYYMSIQKTW